MLSLHTPYSSLPAMARSGMAELPMPTPDTPSMARWLLESLDHVGRGMLLVGAGSRVLHANRQARQALQPGQALVIEDGRLHARGSRDEGLLAEALEGAMRRGLRRMLHLGAPSDPVTVAVLPIDAEGAGAALVSLSQPSRAQDLAVQCFARQHGYTSAETAVLEALLAGERPADIARAKGVALSTVRTQIGQLRLKTGAHSIRQLLDRVVSLPPMMAVVQ
jgi:DNA-binding NarL/FixJ family response regulator